MSRKILVLPRIIVQNANALSSPYTIGFPAMSAWLGFTHNIQRKLNEKGFEQFKVLSTAVISHDANLQVHRGDGDFVNSIVGTANPLDKDGARSAFIEEARIHLKVSLLLECEGVSKRDEERFLPMLSKMLWYMRIAGGDILHFQDPDLYNDPSDFTPFKRKLMPGFALIERNELMREAMNEGKDALEALLHYTSVHNSYEAEEEKWIAKRATAGWIVPIGVGFQGISELGTAKNQRDSETPHRFAESIVTLGEFKMVYKIESLDEILWQQTFDQDNDLYLCKQK